MVTTVNDFAVGDRLTATELNVGLDAIRELQAGAGRMYFEQTKTGQTVTAGAAQAVWGTWTTGGTDNLFLSNGSGISVPQDGVYGICLVWGAGNANSFDQRAFHDFYVGASSVYRAAISVTGETTHGATLIQQLTAGQVITPQRYQQAGTTSATNVITMKISRLSV